MQKNKNVLGISFIVVSVLLAVSVFFGLWNHGRADKKYRDLLTEHYGTIEDIKSLKSEIANLNTELEGYKLKTDENISGLNDTINSTSEIIEPLQDVGSEIECGNQEIEKSVEGIREILQEVLAGNN